MICELCGQDAPFLKPLLIEGSLLKVCSVCAKFGKESPSEPSLASKSEASEGGNKKAQFRGGYGYTGAGQSKEEIIKQRLEHRARRLKSKNIYDESGEKELIEDYHKRIQEGRNKLGWNQEQLGQKINERKSIISKLENRSIKPDDKLIRKLEKALNIKLMETIDIE